MRLLPFILFAAGAVLRRDAKEHGAVLVLECDDGRPFARVETAEVPRAMQWHATTRTRVFYPPSASSPLFAPDLLKLADTDAVLVVTVELPRAGRRSFTFELRGLAPTCPASSPTPGTVSRSHR